MAPKSLCLITALAPVPAFLGASRPLGCSLSAPATGGCSVFSLQCSMYAAGSEEEKRAGCPLHGGTIAQLFVFCNGGLAGLSNLPSSTEGEKGAYGGGRRFRPHRPPTFSRTGGHAAPPGGALDSLHPPSGDRRGLRSALRGTRCTPGGGCAPCTLLGERRRRRLATWGAGRFLACPRVRRQGGEVLPGVGDGAVEAAVMVLGGIDCALAVIASFTPGSNEALLSFPGGESRRP